MIANNFSIYLNGTYILQFNKETVHVGNQTFTSKSEMGAHVLPSVLTNITSKGLRDYVHDISIRNIRYLGALNEKFKLSLITEVIVAILIASANTIIWKKITGKARIPIIRLPFTQPAVVIPPRNHEKSNTYCRDTRNLRQL